MPIAEIEGFRRDALTDQIKARFDDNEARPEFLAVHDIVKACYASAGIVPTPNTLRTAHAIREGMQAILSQEVISHWNRTDRSNPPAAAGVDFADIGGPDVHLPQNAILMWGGLLVDIPAGWALCDGAGGRPDLRDKFIRGAAVGVDPGATGGSDTHTHADHNMLAHTGTAVANHAAQAHSGSAVGDHAAQSHSGSTVGNHPILTHSGTAVGDHAAHTHAFTQSVNASTPNLLKTDTGGAGVAAQGTTGNPSATLTHSVTQPNDHAALVHAVTQPNDHVVQTHTAASSLPAYFALAFIIKL